MLSRHEPNQRGEFRCRICEDFPAHPTLPVSDDGSGLTFYPKGLSEGDVLAIDINGTAIPAEHMQWNRHDDRAPFCTIAPSDPPFVFGDNYLGVKLIQPAEKVDGDITIERVECLFRADQA